MTRNEDPNVVGCCANWTPIGWPKPARNHVRLFVMSHDRAFGVFRTSLEC